MGEGKKRAGRMALLGISSLIPDHCCGEQIGSAADERAGASSLPRLGPQLLPVFSPDSRGLAQRLADCPCGVTNFQRRIFNFARSAP
jgi:hypothetical protein